jgi:nucleoside diphosphate kinase
MSKEAVMVVKPEALNARNEIVERIKSIGIEIRDRRIRVLSRELLSQVYAKAPPSIFDEICKHMSTPVEVIFVRGGEQLIEQILNLTGRERSPVLCGHGTIRYEYGVHVPVKLPDGSIYFKNAIHRPRNDHEASRDLKLFREEIENSKVTAHRTVYSHNPLVRTLSEGINS